ncbi:MAG: TIGR01777 family oxidoreductase [Opitutaceae bacterium]|jgi:uncharacterized protein (TIGR01777 family)|nr:TIGR01777 family oxidoreductase [Opitutaceae bacterium]
MTARTLTTRIERPAAEVNAWLMRPGASARLRPPWFAPPDAFSAPASAPASDPRVKIYATIIKSLDHTRCTLTEEIHSPESHEIDPAVLERILAYRHATIRADIEHAAVYGRVRRLRIAIAGATGMIGRALAPFLQTQNHEVIPLARDPATGAFSPNYLAETLPAADAIINLAGANIAAAKWDQPQRDLIWESRAATTRALVAALAQLKHRPYALLNASATACYGTRGDALLDETAPRGAGFLADVCAGWEHEATVAAGYAIRVTNLRFGKVLSPAGGALAAMLPYFRKKLGMKLGQGRQWTSWISIDDCIAAIYHALLTHACAGPVNITAPNPVTNAAFAGALAKVHGQKRIPRLPRWLVRLRCGIDFANETLLASTRATPAKLCATGYAFRHPDLETALAHLL